MKEAKSSLFQSKVEELFQSKVEELDAIGFSQLEVREIKFIFVSDVIVVPKSIKQVQEMTENTMTKMSRFCNHWIWWEILKRQRSDESMMSH